MYHVARRSRGIELPSGFAVPEMRRKNMRRVTCDSGGGEQERVGAITRQFMVSGAAATKMSPSKMLRPRRGPLSGRLRTPYPLKAQFGHGKVVQIAKSNAILRFRLRVAAAGERKNRMLTAHY